MKRFSFNVFVFLFSHNVLPQAWVPVDNGVPAMDWSYDLVKHKGRLFTCGQGMYVKTQAWNGSSWAYILNITFPGIAYPLTLAEYNDTLYTGGGFPYIQPDFHVYKYVDTAWWKVGGKFLGGYGVKKLFTYNGKLIAGGSFSTIGGATRLNVAAWDGGAWTTMGNGLNGVVYYFAEHNGQLFASGGFSASGATLMRRFAKWDGTSWSALDSTVKFRRDGPMISLKAQLILANVYDTIAGVPMYGVTAWNGATFTPMGFLPDGTAQDFCVFNDDLYLCKDNAVLKWTGTAWVQIGGTFNDRVFSIEHYNGELYCSGFYDTCDNTALAHVSRFSESAGISNRTYNPGLSVYPNPVAGRLNFRVNEIPFSSCDVSIINVLGEAVCSWKNQALADGVDLYAIPSGIYFLKIESGGEQTVIKIIIN